MSVSNFEKNVFVFKEFYRFIFLKFETLILDINRP